MRIWDKLNQLVNARNALLVVVISFLGILFTNGVPFIYADGYYYYHVARSIVDTGSFVQTTEPEYYDYRGHAIAYYDGKYGDVCSPGAAIVNVPGLFISKQFRSSEQNIYNDYYLGFNGHTLADGTAILLTASLFGLATIILIYKSFKLLGITEKRSIFYTFALYSSTYAIWYVFLNPSYTHTYELFSICLLVWAYLKHIGQKLEKVDKKETKGGFGKYKYPLIMGLAVGFGFLTRPLLIFPGFLFGIVFLVRKQFKSAFMYVLGNLPFWIIWMLYNYISYGSPIASGYDVIRGENFNISLDNFNFFNVLFSWERGWFVYSPLFLIGVGGLIFTIVKKKYLTEAILGIVTIVFIALMYGFWPAWWGGGSYGARFLIMLAPFTIWGFVILDKVRNVVFRKVLLVIVILCSLYTMSLTLLYRFTPVAILKTEGQEVGKMGLSDSYTPLDIYQYHLDLIRDAGTPSKYFNNLYKSANGGASYLAIALGVSDPVFRIDDRLPENLTIHLLTIKNNEETDNLTTKMLLFQQVTKKAYTIELKSSVDQKDFVMTFVENVPVAQGAGVTIEEMIETPKSLSFLEYTGIKPNKLSVELYFPKSFNVQFKGPLIGKPPGVDGYVPFSYVN